MPKEKSWYVHYAANVAKEIEIPNKSLPEMLEETNAKFPHHNALSFYGKKMTYQELTVAVHGFASSLQVKNVRKGDRVAIMLPNCPQYVIAYYGILLTGGIVTQLNPMLIEREIDYILKDSGAETLIVLDALYPRVKAIQSQTALKNIIVVSMQSTTSVISDENFETFMKHAIQPPSPVEIDPNQDVAVLQYTGGTTGVSKGAMLTHRNIYANILQAYEFFKEKTNFGCDKFLTVVPLFHVFGMTICMNNAVFTASELILLPRFDVDEVLNTIKQEQPTHFPGVPTMYIALMNHPTVEEFGLECLKVCNSGSAPMPVELLKEFERKIGVEIIEGFGLSEASPVTHVNPLFAKRKPGSVGIGFPSTDYKIMDLGAGLEEVPVGELGELVIKGPQVMKGYCIHGSGWLCVYR